MLSPAKRSRAKGGGVEDLVVRRITNRQGHMREGAGASERERWERSTDSAAAWQNMR